MKIKSTKLIAMLLAVCMMFSFSSVAFAKSVDTKSKINYVSIGDSMANGYGFVGYNQDSDNRDVYDFLTGEGMYGAGAYPLQFEEYLEGYVGEGNVNHTKLAPSALLAEDLLYLLGGLEEEIDDGWWGYRSYIGTYDDDTVKKWIIQL